MGHSESLHGGGNRALALQSKGQWFDLRHRQLEKVVKPEENSQKL